MIGRSTLAGFVALALAACLSNSASADPPYPTALKAAAVHVKDLPNMAEGLLVGNGEMNAVVYADGNDLRLRVAKNDCWDVRVDTKSDPPLPHIDPATGEVSGHGAAGSWKKPYPTALPCVEIVLAGPKEKTAVTSGTCDLDRAVATVVTYRDTAESRVLAQSNVVLIRSARPLSLVGPLGFLRNKDLAEWVLPAATGQKEGLVYLHQPIPGDEDAPGMDVYVVAGRKGDLHAVAVATSRDSRSPLEAATALVRGALADADAVAKHEAAWRKFWSVSGVELADTELQNWWYRMLYFNRTFARAGGNAIGLAANFTGLAGWHNSLKLNYNIQQTYLAAVAAGHPEMLEPFIDVLARAIPRGRWFARTSFEGAEGVFFHSDFYPFEPDPEKCVTPCRHQQAYLPWGYTWGMAGHASAVIWEYYSYAPSPERLERVYPLVKGFGEFYCSLLERCALVGGKRRMGPSFFPELGSYSEYNVAYDIHFVTAALRIARQAAELKGDAPLLARINAVIEQVPTYGTHPDPEQGGLPVIEHWSGSRLDEGADRHGTLVQGIFPAGVIHWFSSEEMKQLGRRTINYVERSTNHANSNVTINIARARLGLGDEAIANAKMCFSADSNYSPEQENGLFSWKGHGYYMTEQVCVNRLVTELLLQSVGGAIRIFPAWPAAADARFHNLLAEGGFEVSAEQVAGTIANIKIRSTAGGTVKLLSPWKGGFRAIDENSGTEASVTASGEVGSFATAAGRTYRIEPARQKQ
jgi:hypothetical protein